MADNKNIRGRNDRNRVAAGEPYEVNYLCEKFGVERQIVMDAIKTCGNDRQQIEDYLKERTGRGRSNFSDGRNSPQ